MLVKESGQLIVTTTEGDAFISFQKQAGGKGCREGEEK